MESFDLTCIGCPLGCLLKVEKEGDEIRVQGNSCPNGKKYGEEEVTNPKRILTSSIRVRNGEEKMCSVKTTAPIPKDLILPSSEIIREITVDAPIEIGTIIIHGISGTNVDVVATRRVKERA